MKFIKSLMCRLRKHKWRIDRSANNSYRYKHYCCQRCGEKQMVVYDFGD